MIKWFENLSRIYQPEKIDGECHVKPFIISEIIERETIDVVADVYMIICEDDAF